MVKRLDGYTYTQIHFPDKLDQRALESLMFIKAKENLILYGGVGTGKTHLAVGLGVKVIQEGKKVVFYPVQSLSTLWKMKFKDKESSRR